MCAWVRRIRPTERRTRLDDAEQVLHLVAGVDENRLAGGPSHARTNPFLWNGATARVSMIRATVQSYPPGGYCRSAMTTADIFAARGRIAPHIRRTPLVAFGLAVGARGRRRAVEARVAPGHQFVQDPGRRQRVSGLRRAPRRRTGTGRADCDRIRRQSRPRDGVRRRAVRPEARGLHPALGPQGEARLHRAPRRGSPARTDVRGRRTHGQGVRDRDRRHVHLALQPPRRDRRRGHRRRRDSRGLAGRRH